MTVNLACLKTGVWNSAATINTWKRIGCSPFVLSTRADIVFRTVVGKRVAWCVVVTIAPTIVGMATTADKLHLFFSQNTHVNLLITQPKADFTL